jgi:hypothetical protein
VLGAPEDGFWNSDGEPFDSLFPRSVGEGRDPSGSAETGSAWVLPLIEDFQAPAITPGLGSMSGDSLEYGSHRYITANLHLPSTRIG